MRLIKILIAVGLVCFSLGLIYYMQKKITRFDLPKGELKIGSGAFMGCKALREITIPSGWVEDYAFDGCSSLSTVTLSEGIGCIGEYAFSDCTSLTSIVFPKDTARINEYVFSGCEALCEVTLPKDATIEEYAFDDEDEITFYYV